LNRYAKILEHGGKVNFGSDNMPLSPLFGIKHAITFPSSDIRISVEEALKAYTIHNAHALFMENKIGSLKEGKHADFVIMKESPIDVNPSELNDTLIENTDASC